jgi:L-alanine-DL-glutamate epimerase-like enolase superfamily enzyme
MDIDSIRIYSVRLPFSLHFSHALRKRSSVNNVVVEVIGEQGKIKGYGEGAPRSFVTGETQKSAIQTIQHLIRQYHFPWRIDDIEELWNFIDRIGDEKTQNAAVCALETGLLDAFGRCQGINLIDFFPDDFLIHKIYYGIALPLAGKKTLMELCLQAQKMKIRKLKLKVGKDLVQNREMLEAVRTVFGEDYNLKIDVNGVWNRELALKHESLLMEYNVKVVEQPMPPDAPDLADFALRMKHDGVTLMADESACSLDDVKKIVKIGHYRMINVRLSKCGGMRNSLKMIDYLRCHGISFQIGCHLGESGILSAAGRVLCLLCNDAVYYDGSYDEYLLEKNVTIENVSFGPGGEAGPLNGPGLGVKVSGQNLSGLSQGAPAVIERPRRGAR